MKIQAQLRSVVALLNVKKWKALREQPLLQKQISFANKIMLSFVDQAEEADIAEAEEFLASTAVDCLVRRKDRVEICQFLE